MNRIILIGNLTRDPELRTTQSGIAVCSFTVACNRRASKQGEREADFINCVAWRERGEFVSRYFTKGRKIAVEGTLQIRSYEALDGSKRTAAEVVVDNVEFVDSKPEGGAERRGDYDAGRRDSYGEQQAMATDGFTEVPESELPF